MEALKLDEAKLEMIREDAEMDYREEKARELWIEEQKQMQFEAFWDERSEALDLEDGEIE